MIKRNRITFAKMLIEICSCFNILKAFYLLLQQILCTENLQFYFFNKVNKINFNYVLILKTLTP